jgi:4-amino-4-deoxy-L-arabinose transferase-like glycosyltransferase
MIKIPKNRVAYFTLAIIILIGFSIRVYTFSQLTTPNEFTFSADPAHYYQLAVDIYEGRGPGVNAITQFWYRVPFGYPDTVWEPLFSFIISFFFMFLGKTIMSAKIMVLLFSLASIVLVYLAGRTIYNEKTGLIAAFLFAIQPKHAIYSIAILKDNVFVFFFMASFLLLYLAFKYDKLRYWALLGVFIGLTFLTRYMGGVLVLTLLILAFARRKNISLTYVGISVLCIIAVILPWGIYTNSFFDQPFFSVTKYYSYSDTGWVGMSYENSAPSIGNYINKNSVADILSVRLMMIPMALYAIPVWFTPIIFLLVIYIFLVKNDDYLYNLKVYFFVMIVLYFIQFSSENMLNERVFFALVYISLIPIAYSIPEVSAKLSGMVKNRVEKKHMTVLILFLIALSSIFMLQWNMDKIHGYEIVEKKQAAFKEFGDWSKSNIDENSIIMTTLPLDIHYYTGKRTVMDPYNYAISIDEENKLRYENRSLDEIENYNVTHVLINGDNDDYLFGFKGLNLKLVYEDSSDKLYLYEVPRT